MQPCRLSVVPEREMISEKLDADIRKASEIMWKYCVAKEDQIAIVRILVDWPYCGLPQEYVERCLDEQQRIREESAALVNAACGLPN